MDATIHDTLSKLKFISKLQKGEKINVKYLYVQPNNWWSRISRTFYNTDNRMNAYHFIESTINRGFELIVVNKQKACGLNNALIDNILFDLQACMTGIENFKDTYADDVMFCCKLDTLIQSIQFRIQNEQLCSGKMEEVD